MFRFKQFTIQQDACAMKIGTDGIVLGASVPLERLSSPKILDIGTGTGLLALMLAQSLSANETSDFHIDALEIDAAAAAQAAQNVAHSPWKNHIDIQNIAVQDYKTERLYDLIVSNPPYFTAPISAANGALSDNNRRRARHAESLSYADLLHAAKRLLLPDALLYLILPALSTSDFLAQAAALGFVCVAKTEVYGRASKPVERCILGLQLNTSTRAFCQQNQLCIYAEGQQYTAEYSALTKDFYIGLKKNINIV